MIVHQGSSISVSRKDGAELEYSTNTPVQIGLALDYRWLAVEATFSVNGSGGLDPRAGPTSSTGLGFGYTGRSWWFRNFFRRNTGFHVSDPEMVDPDWEEGEDLPYRADISNTTYMASINHGFNWRRFSYSAAIWQLERQKRSAGSWTAGATFWYSRTECTGGLLPEYQRELYEATSDASLLRRWMGSITEASSPNMC